MKRVLLGVAVWVATQFLIGCGGDSKTTAVTITPTTATVGASQTFQFSATITDNSNTTVTWEVNGVAGGAASTGTVSTTGLYTAPTTVISTTTTITVTAVSAADTSKTASATVTLTSSSSSSATTPPFLSLNPTFVTLAAGSQQTFSATLNQQGQTPTAANVVWSLSCQGQTSDACGAISASGVFTAPAAPPPGGEVSITATTTDNSASPANAGARIQFGSSTLSGQYAFLLRGASSGAFYAAAGSLTFDGGGSITGGLMDVNNGAATQVAITGGTYHVGTDGRVNATVNTASGTQTWAIVVLNHSEAYVSRMDSGTVRASGTLSAQNASQFSAASITGNYTVRLEGVNVPASSARLRESGAFTADGTSALTTGLLDANSGGTVSSGLALAGAFTAPTGTGRGMIMLNTTLGSQTFAYYLVDSQRAKLVETDATLVTAGEMVHEPTGTFTAASFRGSYAFTLEGNSVQGPLGEGGTFTLDGAGNVTAATVDTNNNGNFTSSPTPITGTYTVANAAVGRTTMTLNVSGNPMQFAFYPQTGGSLNLIQIDTLKFASGVAYPQVSGGLNAATFGANFGLRLSGFDFTGSPGQEEIVGQLIPNGGSALSGTLDINDNGTLSPQTSVSGSYSINSSTLQGTATLSNPSGSSFNLYVVDSTRVLWLEKDGNRVLVGNIVKQF